MVRRKVFSEKLAKQRKETIRTANTPRFELRVRTRHNETKRQIDIKSIRDCEFVRFSHLVGASVFSSIVLWLCVVSNYHFFVLVSLWSLGARMLGRKGIYVCSEVDSVVEVGVGHCWWCCWIVQRLPYRTRANDQWLHQNQIDLPVRSIYYLTNRKLQSI